MPNIPPSEASKSISEAKEQLALAMSELETVMKELTVSERADKQMVSARVDAALRRLKAAKEKLEALLVPA